MKRKSLVEKKYLVHVVEFIWDKILTPIRPFLILFYLLEKCLELTVSLIHILSNEFKKSKFSYCGRSVRIYGKSRFIHPNNIKLGNNVHINDNAYIRADTDVTISENTHISRNLLLYTSSHNYEGSLLPYDDTFILKPVYIDKNVWIGMNVTILPGVRIGEGAIIGMGSTVTRDVAPLSIVGGNPATVIKNRNDEHYSKLEHENRYSGISGLPYSKG